MSWEAAAGNLIGNLFGSNSDKAASDYAVDVSKETRELNYQRQKEFAQHGLRWKIDDAKAAGIHPLFALGGNTASYTPSAESVGSVHSDGNTYRQLGQDIGRAISATKTQEEKEFAALQLAAMRADVEGKALDNQIRQSKLSTMNLSGPAFPGSQNLIPGQGNSPLIKNTPQERTSTRPGSPHVEPGAVAGVGYQTLSDGSLVPVPSDNVKQKIEDNVFHEGMHFLRNNILPNFGSTSSKPPASEAPKGYRWKWDHSSQAWRSVPKHNPSTWDRRPWRSWSEKVDRWYKNLK